MGLAQEIDYISSKWSDSFREWLFLDNEEDEIGFLRLKWELKNDFYEWTFELNDLRGDIKTKWRDDPSLWEMYVDGDLLNARPVFPGDYSRWKISYDNAYYTLSHDYGLNWSVDGHDYKITSTYNGDPRDWSLQGDYGTLEKPLEIFVIFLSIYNSIPKQ